MIELLEELHSLEGEYQPSIDEDFPFILAAGERRSSTANTIYRNPDWRPSDRDGALRMSPNDAQRLGIQNGSRARVTTARGEAVVVVEVTETMQTGHVSLPNGSGVTYPDSEAPGVAPNERRMRTTEIGWLVRHGTSTSRRGLRRFGLCEISRGQIPSVAWSFSSAAPFARCISWRELSTVNTQKIRKNTHKIRKRSQRLYCVAPSVVQLPSVRCCCLAWS